MKGIILAGGKGTRLYPMTRAISKHLIPIYDKPMIYYPLATLMLGNIRDILIVSTPEDILNYEKLFQDGAQWGLHITYLIQETPKGLADVLLIGRQFIGEDSVCLILGDNLFFGQGLSDVLKKVNPEKATIFAYAVSNPQDFGVVEFDKNGKVIGIEEKPENPMSKYAVPGLYFYPNNVVNLVQNIKPSARGELEISSINMAYLNQNKLNVAVLSRGFAWLDAGTPQGLLKASTFVEVVQSRQGFYIACIEEVAWRMGFINIEQLHHLALQLRGTDYGKYILSLRERS